MAPEQRNCLHCGGRLSDRRDVAGASLRPRAAAATPPREAEMELPFEPAEDGEEMEEESARAATIRRGITVVWVVLALIPVLYRACT